VLPIPRAMRRTLLTRSVVVAVILVAALAAAAGAWRFEEARADDEQDARAQASTAALRSQLAAVVVSLEGLRGLIEGGHGADAATFEPFAAYALASRGGLLAAWIPRVTRGERSAFEREAGVRVVDGENGVTRPAAPRAEYFPVALTQPRALGRPLVGLDVGASVVGHALIAEARDTGLTRISEPAALPGQGTVIILVRAVYGRGRVAADVASRRAAFSGVVATANRLEDIGRAVLADLPEGTALEIREGDRVLLPARGDLDGASEDRLDIAGRAWTVRVAGAPGPSPVLPLTVLGAGLVLAALVWLLLWESTRRQAGVERAAAELAAAAAEVSALNDDLERRVAERTAELAAANRELEAFSYSVSHDLRAPLRSVGGMSAMLVEDHGDELGPEARGLLGRIRAGAERMGELIDDLLGLARISRAEMHREPVDLAALARKVAAGLRDAHPDRDVELRLGDDLEADGDPRLLRVILDNLLGNAWKFTEGTEHAVVEVGAEGSGPERRFYVRDNGAGFDMAYVDKLFGPFQRLHHHDEFEGTGIGLATVQRVVRRHGGEVWAEGAVGAGATISFTLPPPKGPA
jgi:signal transduction histidine kinase